MIFRVGMVVLGLLAAACGGPSPTPTPLEMIQPVECIGVPASTCQEIVVEARRNARPGTFAVRVRAACTRPECTSREGDVAIDVLYSDGRTESWGMGWSGAIDAVEPGPQVDPTLAATPMCQGVPPDRCAEMAISVVSGDPAGSTVVSILVRCTAAPCTAEHGTGETIITLNDGTTSEGSWSYQNASPSG